MSHRCTALVLACLVTLGCNSPGSEPPPREPPRATQEPVRTRIGGREVSVQCALECPGLVSELDSLTARCAADPLGTARAIESDARRVAAMCCTQAEEAYRRACGFDEPELDACRGRWSVQCVQR